MINSVTLVGRVTKDLELKYSQSGVAVCKFNIAVNRNFKSKDGEQQADFPMILTFRKTAENVANFLKKGSLVGVTGRIQTGSYEKDGQRVFTTEILADLVQFLEPKNSNSNNTPSGQSKGGYYPGNTNTSNQTQNAPNRQETTSQSTYGGNDPFSSQGAPIEVNDDDLPF